MAGAWTTLSIKDGGGTSRTMRAWDESGTGAGPFSFGQVLGDGSGGAAILGAQADAKSSATDTTAVSSQSVWKQISASVQALVAGIIATGTQAAPSGAYLSTVSAGDIAAAAADSGNPVKIGGVGKIANPTAVTDGQRVNALFDKLGKQVTVGAVRDLKGKQKTTITSSTGETTIVTAAGANVFADLYGLTVANTSASACNVTIKDATAGTTQFILSVPAGETRGFISPVDSAVPQTAANNNWSATCSASVASIEITALFVKNT